MFGPIALALALLSAPPPPNPITLEAASLHATVGEPRRAELRRSGALVPWPESDWFFVRSGGGALNLSEVELAGGRALLPIPPQANALEVLGLDLSPQVAYAPAAAWGRFLEEHGLEGPATEGELLRVRRVESLKAIVRRASDAPSAGALAKTGQAVELRPVADPTTLAAYGDLPLRGYAPGGASGAHVIARHTQSGEVRRTRLDGSGLGTLRLGLAGPWVVQLLTVRGLEGDAQADLELAIATLTFDVPGEQR